MGHDSPFFISSSCVLILIIVSVSVDAGTTACFCVRFSMQLELDRNLDRKKTGVLSLSGNCFT